MFSFNALPQDERVRVYVALSIASMQIDALFRGKPDAHGNYRMILESSNPETIQYLWTAYRIIGQSHKQFNIDKNLKIIDVGRDVKVHPKPFDPSKETNMLGKFSSGSLYEKVFVPVLKGQKIKFNPNEANMVFGHLVPEDEKVLLNAVSLYFCQYHLDSTFIYDATKKEMALPKDSNAALIHTIGPVKLAQCVHRFTKDKVDVLNLSRVNAEVLGADGLALVVSHAEFVKKFKLYNTNLSALPVEGICKVLAALSKTRAVDVDLACNKLSQFNETELQKIVNSIPAQVTRIDLTDNGIKADVIARLLKNRVSVASSANPYEQLPVLPERKPVEPSAPPLSASSSSNSKGLGFFVPTEPSAPPLSELDNSNSSMKGKQFFPRVNPASNTRPNDPPSYESIFPGKK